MNDETGYSDEEEDLSNDEVEQEDEELTDDEVEQEGDDRPIIHIQRDDDVSDGEDENDLSVADEDDEDEDLDTAQEVVVDYDHADADRADAHEDGDAEDDDDEEVLTAVVVDYDDEDMGSDDGSTVAVVEAVAVPEPEPLRAQKKKTKKTSSPKKQKSSKKRNHAALQSSSRSSPKKTAVSSNSKSSKKMRGNTGKAGAKSVVSTNHKSKKKGIKKMSGSTKENDVKQKNKGKTISPIEHNTRSTNADDDLYENVPPALKEAANDARAMLRDSVPVLPFPVAETQVRSLGRLCIQVGSSSKNGDGHDHRLKIRSKFCTTTALYPVGFSCDRYEFSPVHGRILKMRCSILDGRSIKSKQKELIRAATESASTSSSAATSITITKTSDIHDGPVFRITWGRGLDEDPEKDAEYQYDPDVHSPPLIVNKKGKPKNTVPDISVNEKLMKPEKGMRVKVRADKDQFYNGSITEVTRPAIHNKNSKKTKHKSNNSCKVTVLYDYGTSETFHYPDPDLVIVMPGSEDELGPGGELELTELNGKPVVSVVGESPLEAWAQALSRLGLIDEIMLKRAFHALNHSREEGLHVAKDKVDVKQKTKGNLHTSTPDRRESSSDHGSGDGDDIVVTLENGDTLSPGYDRDPPSEREKALRERVQDLLASLEEAKEEDRKAQIQLADARILHLGPFLCNPFYDEDSSKSQQTSWLITAVRKEKTRMGSTGNKKKVVTSLDLLERNNSFYNADIESIIEGLPGSELCKPYVFQGFRTASGSANRLWLEETQMQAKAETEKFHLMQKKAREAQIREEQELEREMKKRKRDEIRDSRKMQKLAEEEGKKKARIDERLSRLELQIKDRLFKDAAFQREKVIMAMARSISKEFNRRRKAAELVAGQSIVDFKKKTSKRTMSFDADPLPSIAKIYNEDTVRVWNFMTTFKSLFLQRGYVQEIPSLESLQTAIDCINGKVTASPMTRDEAVSSLTGLSVALCKPLAASLTRALFASLIALNPALQKDFGAAFFNGVNATTSGTDDSVENSGHPNVLLPVNEMTWQEIARLAFLSDSLGEMGYVKQEAAHILRGYRSAGHPNSREAKRLRKAEHVAIAILRQKIFECRKKDMAEFFHRDKTRITVPCSPFPSDKPSERAAPGKWPWKTSDEIKADHGESKNTRLGMGLLNWLNLSKGDYEKQTTLREKYMEDALLLKEEMERSMLKEEEDEEDDDDDDDEEENAGSRTEASKSNGSVDKEGPDSGSHLNGDTGEVAGRKIGKVSKYDDFCRDIPDAPEMLRRCLAVLRTLSGTGPAESFLYPVDPQTNPGYYDNVVRPMCLRAAGKQLHEACFRFKNYTAEMDEAIEEVVVQFGRNIRLIAQNCSSYANAGPMVIAAGSELLRIFERLFFDWVLVPQHLLPPLQDLDDDKCVEHHVSDDDATVLFCDGCEGKYNISRLDPPLSAIPTGDWYCPRCVNERWFGSLDPRIGKVVRKVEFIDGKAELSRRSGRISKCSFSYGEEALSKPSLVYSVVFDDGSREVWSLAEVDQALALLNIPVQPVRCIQAVAESPGYGFGVDFGLRNDLIPVALNPNISDSAAQVALSSSVFRDTLTASATLLLIDARQMNASEWLRLLVLLVMKCSSSDVIQNLISKMESEAADRMTKPLENVSQISGIQEILPAINEDYGDDSSYTAHDEHEEIDDAATSNDPFPVVSQLKGKIKEEATEATTCNSQDFTIPPVEVAETGVADALDGTRLDPVASIGIVSSADIALEVVPAENVAPFTAAFMEKGKRQKAVEESMVAWAIKNQIKPAVASLEEDTFSPAVDACLSSIDEGLQFSSLRCRRMSCHFCGLNDIALGLPLVRVPDETEWEDTFAHAARSRRSHLVAEIPSDSPGESYPGSKLIVVRIKIGGELVSLPDKGMDEMVDGGMLEFLPRAKDGFQDELKFRSLYSLPFVSGSLSAHECCAIAVHNARKDLMVQKYKEHQAELVEKETGMSCGRTLEIGRDCIGRSYWKFDTLPETLFVCIEGDVDRSASGDTAAVWHHYADPASIASVIVCLKNDQIVKDLCRSYPEAHQLIRDGTWQEILLKKRYPNVTKYLTSDAMQYDSEGDLMHQKIQGGDSDRQSFKVGDSVLIESQLKNLLWDARIIAVSKCRGSEANENHIIDAYRVEYKGWGHRFAEWVNPSRVLQLSDERKLLQDAKFDERSLSKCGLPPSLNLLNAKDYLQARDRARENSPLPDFARVSHTSDNRSMNQKTFALMQAAALAIEAALPMGSVDTSEAGVWRFELAQQWRLHVIEAEGPASLMRCIFFLEDAILPEWVKEDVGYLRSCLPDRWKAVGEASSSSLAIRVILLDRSLKYGKVDRKAFAKKKK